MPSAWPPVRGHHQMHDPSHQNAVPNRSGNSVIPTTRKPIVPSMQVKRHASRAFQKSKRQFPFLRLFFGLSESAC